MAIDFKVNGRPVDVDVPGGTPLLWVLRERLKSEIPEIEEDRDVLRQIMERVESSPNPVKHAGALGAELLTSLRGRVPMLGAGSAEVARLEEIELLTLGIEGKRLLWKALGRLARSDARLAGFSFTELAKRAKAQRDRLEPFRLVGHDLVVQAGPDNHAGRPTA